MKYLFFALLFVSTQEFLFSQNISVKSFQQLPNDLDARVTYPKKDQNGEKCAIIKVVTFETGFSWEGDMLGIVAAEKKVGEYWIYLPHGSKRLTIKHDFFGVLRDFTYPEPIIEATCYELILYTHKEDKSVSNVEKQWLTITSEPKGSSIYINNNFEGFDTVRKYVSPGIYHYQVAAYQYHVDTGVVVVPNGFGKSLKVVLNPKFGFAEVNSLPKDGAEISINGVNTNLTTPSLTDKLLSGEYTFSIKKRGYQTLSKNVIIKEGQTEQVTFSMVKNRDFVKQVFKKHMVSISAGYYNTTFSNSFFNDNLSNGNIKKGLGYAASLNLNFFPIFLDFTYFSSSFTVNNIEPFSTNGSVVYRGGEISLLYSPFILGSNVYPYFGLGYQYSQLYTKDIEIGESASSSFSLPLIKVGTKIRIKRIIVSGEYKIALDFFDTGVSSNQYFCGVGFLI